MHKRMVLYKKLMCCCTKTARTQMFPQVKPINYNDLTHEEFKIGEDGQYCFPKLELIKEQRIYKIQKLEIIALNQCQFILRKSTRESQLNASQILMASTNDWKVNTELLRAIQLRLEASFLENSDSRSKSGLRQPLSLLSIGFQSNDEP